MNQQEKIDSINSDLHGTGITCEDLCAFSEVWIKKIAEIRGERAFCKDVNCIFGHVIKLKGMEAEKFLRIMCYFTARALYEQMENIYDAEKGYKIVKLDEDNLPEELKGALKKWIRENVE